MKNLENSRSDSESPPQQEDISTAKIPSPLNQKADAFTEDISQKDSNHPLREDSEILAVTKKSFEDTLLKTKALLTPNQGATKKAMFLPLVITLTGCFGPLDQFYGCSDNEVSILKEAIRFLRKNKNEIEDTILKLDLKIAVTLEIQDLLYNLNNLETTEREITFACGDLTDRLKYNEENIDAGGTMNPFYKMLTIANHQGSSLDNIEQNKEKEAQINAIEAFNKLGFFDESNLTAEEYFEEIKPIISDVNQYIIYKHILGVNSIASTILHELAHKERPFLGNHAAAKRNNRYLTDTQYKYDEVEAWGKAVDIVYEDIIYEQQDSDLPAELNIIREEHRKVTSILHADGYFDN